MSDASVGTSYRGPSGVARDSEWMSNEDVSHTADTVLTIEDVKFYKTLKFGPRSEDRKLSIKFKDRKRELVLNATNRKTVALLYGADTTEWIGKQLALWVEKDIRRPDNTRGPAIRFRAKRITPAATKADAAPAPADPIDADLEREANRSES